MNSCYIQSIMLTYVVLAFAAIFMVTGIFRVVEFKAAGISRKQRIFLIPIHIVGCIAFSLALALLVLDPTEIHKAGMTACFFTGILILFPMHIYVNIKRKIKIAK